MARNVFVLWLVTTLVGVVFYSVIWPAAPIVFPDSSSYVRIATDLRDGSLDSLYLRPPGYALFLLATNSVNEPRRSLFYVQLALHFLCILALALLLCRLGLHRKLIAAFFVISVLPFSVESSAGLLTENLCQFLLATGFVGLAVWLHKGQRLWLWASGFAFAYAALVRPTFQLIGPFLAVMLVALPNVYEPFRAYAKRTYVAAVVMLFWTALLVGGFAVHNYARFGYLGVVPAAGFHLSNKNWPVLERLPDEDRVARDILIAYRDRQLVQKQTAVNYIWAAIPELKEKTGLSEFALGQYLQKLNLMLIKRAPLNYVTDVATSIVHYWLPAMSEVGFLNSRVLFALFVVLHFAVLAVALVVNVRLVGGWLVWLERDRSVKERQPSVGFSDDSLRVMLSLLLAGILFYTMALSVTFDAADPRFRQPTDLLLFVLVALEIEVWRRTRNRTVQPEVVAEHKLSVAGF